MKSPRFRLGIQAKLLRVLDDRIFERLGGTDTLRMDARIWRSRTRI